MKNNKEAPGFPLGMPLCCLILIGCIGFLIPQIATAQDKTNNLQLDGKVHSEDQLPIPSFTIELDYRWGKTQTLVFNDTNGRFLFYIDFDRRVKATFKAEGYRDKILVIDTRKVPAEERTWGYEFGGFIIDMVPLGNDSTPIHAVRIFFSPEAENFDFTKY